MGSVNQQYNLAITVRSTDCFHCGTLILMSDDFMATRRRDHKTFHCTACGGAQCWRKDNEMEALRKQLEAAERQRAFAQQNAASERAAREQTQRRLSATIGAKTRIVNRIKNGVCPCCNRTFVNLLHHMAKQHPDFQKSEDAK